MKLEDAEILLVEPDENIAEMIVEHLGDSSGWNDGLNDEPGVNIRHLTTAEQALGEFCVKPADIVLTAWDLPDGCAMTMTREMKAHAPCAVIFLTPEPTVQMTIDAMRAGAIDVLVKPFDLNRLTQVVDQALAMRREKKLTDLRQRRLRELATRIVRERRELRRRVDLVCHDLVGAYRNLAQKFVEQTDASAIESD